MICWRPTTTPSCWKTRITDSAPSASQLPLPAALCGRFAFGALASGARSREEWNSIRGVPTNGGRAVARVVFRSAAKPETGVFPRRPESESGDRDADARASQVVFEVSATTIGGGKSLRKSAHLDWCDAETSSPRQRRKCVRSLLGRRRIDMRARCGSQARVRRHESAVTKKPH